MASVEDLLQPIAGDNPAGEDLYYSPLKREIEEASREDEDLAQGVWKHEVKRADYKKVIQLSTKGLKEKGKDLFIAAYLAEAWARQDGFEGLLRGVELLRGLLETFWDTLYPEIEDGDVEFRATPLGYVASRWEPAIRSYGLTATGVDWYAYKDSLAVPSEDEARSDSGKKGQIRRQAVEDGKLTPEDLDDALKATPSGMLTDIEEQGKAALEAIESFSTFCDEKFDDVAPNFHPVKVALEDVVSSARILADRKGTTSGKPSAPKASPSSDLFGPSSSAPADDPFGDSRAPADDPFAVPSATADDPFAVPYQEEPQDDPFAAPSAPAADPFATPAPAAAPAEDPFAAPSRPAEDPFAAPAPDPFAAPAADRFATPAPAAPSFSAPPPGDPIGAIAAGALALREQDPTNPAAYLALRGLRWGELRAGGAEIDDLLLEAPPREMRVSLKRLAREESWPEVLATAEQAMAQPCGRGWLDIQRYTVEACEALGDEFDRVSEAVRTQLWLLLNDFPDLPERTLDDDTPAANGATLSWIRSLGEGGLPVPPKAVSIDDDDDEEPDAWQVAQRELQRGRADEALAVLRRQLGRETSERARFERQVQMARVCLASKSEAVALPILEDLAGEIERHGLTEWEDAEVVGEPLELLHRCLSKIRPEDERLSNIYDQLCRLDPLRAMRLTR